MQLCFNPNFDSKNRFSTLKHSFLKKISKLNHFNIEFFLIPTTFYGNCAQKNFQADFMEIVPLKINYFQTIPL